MTAKTVTRSATLPWLMNRFDPSMTQSPSPSRRARVRAAAASLPASASVSAKAISVRPAARSGNQRCFWSSLPASSSGSAPSSWTARIRPLVAQTRLICSTARQTVSSCAAEPAVRLGERQPEDVVGGEELLDVPGELGRLVDLGGARRDLLVGQHADRVAEHLLLLGQAVGPGVRSG